MKKIIFGFLFFMVSTAIGSQSFGLSSFEQIIAKAEQGSEKDQVLLGDAYAKGRGVPQDYKMAFSWYKRAAEQGYAQGQRPLGVLYELGRGVNKNGAKAAYWYEKAASQGLARAQVNLGILYEIGFGVVQDYSTAFSWYKKAADQGDGRGINKLALLYEKGWGIEGDINRAIALYERGAMLKYSKAIFNLGRIYSEGVAGVPEDLKMAASWYQKAVNLGFTDALPDLQRIMDRIPEVPTIKPKKIVNKSQIINREVEEVEAVPPVNSKKDEMNLLVLLFVGSVVLLVSVFLLGMLFLKNKKMVLVGSRSIIAGLEGDIKKIRDDIEQLTQVSGQLS